MEQDAALTTKVRGVLSSEMRTIIAIVVFLAGIAAPFYAMRQDIALIKASISNINSNHEAHIQDLNQNLKDALGLIKQQQEQINAIQQQTAVMQQQIQYIQRH